jgi:hypothetical protein
LLSNHTPRQYYWNIILTNDNTRDVNPFELSSGYIKNSVFPSFSLSLSTVIQVLISLIQFCRWNKESVRNGNGEAIEGVWMLCPALYAQVGKINYRDESLTHLTNVFAKWPVAYRQMYQRNRTVKLDGKQGRQLAGDEWVEGDLVYHVK